MLHLAFIFHMHQPYYKNLLTQEASLPWVRLHGVKDYLDMVEILNKFPKIRQTFNLVPSLVEQIEDYANQAIKDKYLEISFQPAEKLSAEEKKFLLENFFKINKETVIFCLPRYYELLRKKERGGEFNQQDYLDLQVWFNLAWIDPYFREQIPELKRLVQKARFFTEEEKAACLDKQREILRNIIAGYKKFQSAGQIEVTISPYYHPILPLVYSSKIAREANPKALLPKFEFSYPQDVKAQVEQAVNFYKERFGNLPCGMWPSEQSVCEHILPSIIEAGINWIVTDEAILFKSLKRKKRDTKLLYQPYLLKRKDGNLNIVFRDRNLSDLIGFVYHRLTAKAAVDDFMQHLEDISLVFKKEDILVSIAMDGENAWEYFVNDGHDFLELLYAKLSEADFVKTTTIAEYLKTHPPKSEIKRLAAGSWIFGDFGKWIGSPVKIKAWEYLALARQELVNHEPGAAGYELALKQIYIAEGSDWFWWAGEDPGGDFDRLFRMHLSNFYRLLQKDIPEYLTRPITT